MATHSGPPISLASWLRLPFRLLRIRLFLSPSEAAMRARFLEDRYSRRLTRGPMRLVLLALRRRAQLPTTR